MAEGSLFAIIDLLLEAKFTLCVFYGMWGYDFHKKFQI